MQARRSEEEDGNERRIRQGRGSFSRPTHLLRTRSARQGAFRQGNRPRSRHEADRSDRRACLPRSRRHVGVTSRRRHARRRSPSRRDLAEDLLTHRAGHKAAFSPTNDRRTERMERLVDLAPAQVWAQLLDTGQLPPCSIRTMYRVLAANAEAPGRRNQLRHPAYLPHRRVRRMTACTTAHSCAAPHHDVHKSTPMAPTPHSRRLRCCR